MCDAFSVRTKPVSAGSSTFRLPGVVAPSARRTTRLTDLLTLIGFALGGEAGNCLVERMGLEATPETRLAADSPAGRAAGADASGARRR